MAEEKQEKVKKAKKISKVIEGHVLTITAGETVMKFDIKNYSPAIRAHLEMHGLSQKLGDAAAGAENTAEAVEYINKVNEGILKGDWSTRAPAGEKVSKKGILEKYEALNEKEKAMAAPLLKKLGLIEAKKRKYRFVLSPLQENDNLSQALAHTYKQRMDASFEKIGKALSLLEKTM